MAGIKVNQRIAIEKTDFREADEISISKDLDSIVAQASFKFLNQGGPESQLEKYDRVVMFADYEDATTPLLAGYIEKISKGFSKTSDYITISCLDNLGLLNELESVYGSSGGSDAGTMLYNVLSINRFDEFVDLSKINQSIGVYVNFSWRGKKLIQMIEKIKEKSVQLIFLDNSNAVQNKIPSILFTEEPVTTYVLERGRNIIDLTFDDITSNINRVVVHGGTENVIGIATDTVNQQLTGRVNELVTERRGIMSQSSAIKVAQELLVEAGKNYIIKTTIPFTPEIELGQLVQIFDPKDGLNGDVFMIRNYTHIISKSQLKTTLGLTANVLSEIPTSVLGGRTSVLTNLNNAGGSV